MNTNFQNPANGAQHGANVPAWITVSSKFLQRTGSSFLGKLSGYLYAVQVSQVKTAMSRMSNAQLAAIGIERHEISRYAEHLMADDVETNAQEMQAKTA